MTWFRYYTAAIESRKIQDLPSPLFKAWVNMLCVASLCNGILPATPDLAFRLRCSIKQASDWLEQLKERRLLDTNADGSVSPHDWSEHQYVSDDVTARVRKHRNAVTRNVSQDVTGNVSRNGIETPRARGQIQKQNQIQKQTSESEPLPLLAGQSECPCILAEIRRHDPAADDLFARRLMATTIQHCLSARDFPAEMLPDVTDEAISRCVAESYRTGPRNHGTGLLLKRVPPIVVTWCIEDDKEERRNGTHPKN